RRPRSERRGPAPDRRHARGACHRRGSTRSDRPAIWGRCDGTGDPSAERATDGGPTSRALDEDGPANGGIDEAQAFGRQSELIAPTALSPSRSDVTRVERVGRSVAANAILAASKRNAIAFSEPGATACATGTGSTPGCRWSKETVDRTLAGTRRARSDLSRTL